MTIENIDADSDASQNHCKLCLQPMPVGAAVCSHCQKHQNWVMRYLSNVGILISFGLLIFAVAQFYQASRERENAKEAAEVAREAAQVANDARQKIESLVVQLKALESTAKRDLEEATRIAESALSKAVVSTVKTQENRKDLHKARKRQIAKEMTELQREINQIQERIWKIELERGKVQNATHLRNLNAEQSRLEIEIYKRSSKLDVRQVELEELEELSKPTPSDMSTMGSPPVAETDIVPSAANKSTIRR
ncbi:MAG: hypothetical protein LJE91_12910 [Gammaproteobacteria bacterium]|jgi:DNA repair exonuclease SbcCD ATPase subunit|nr:hypothetical protein [Gammaproteobacteria bacterium]